MVKLVGILNITPDSFSDGGLYITPDKAIHHAEKLFRDGADLIDIGAESTKPGATPLAWQEEWSRLEPVLPKLLKQFPGQISLDTYHPHVAKKALELDPTTIINDVTGLQNPKMFQLVSSVKAKSIVNHLPQADIQLAHTGKLVDDIYVVVAFLKNIADKLELEGIRKDQIILDPGIGFGKTPELNWQLLEIAKLLPGYQVMIGYSKKRFLGKNRLETGPNLKAADIAIKSGAKYLRVHDVASHAKHLQIT